MTVRLILSVCGIWIKCHLHFGFWSATFDLFEGHKFFLELFRNLTIVLFLSHSLDCDQNLYSGRIKGMELWSLDYLLLGTSNWLSSHCHLAREWECQVSFSVIYVDFNKLRVSSVVMSYSLFVLSKMRSLISEILSSIGYGFSEVIVLCFLDIPLCISLCCIFTSKNFHCLLGFPGWSLLNDSGYTQLQAWGYDACEADVLFVCMLAGQAFPPWWLKVELAIGGDHWTHGELLLESFHDIEICAEWQDHIYGTTFRDHVHAMGEPIPDLTCPSVKVAS